MTKQIYQNERVSSVLQLERAIEALGILKEMVEEGGLVVDCGDLDVSVEHNVVAISDGPAYNQESRLSSVRIHGDMRYRCARDEEGS